MQLKAAIQYIFEDREWVGKIVIVFALSFTSIIMMPVLLIGLLPFCVLLGYTVAIVNNVRDRRAVILPQWDDFSDFMIRGVGTLVAMIVYSIPILLLVCCILTLPGIFNDTSVGGLVLATTLLCIMPVIIIYTVFSWIMLATATVIYARGSSINVYFQVGTLYEKARATGIYSVQWLIYALIVTLLLATIAIIPGMGWLVAGSLMIPIQGHLLGQYARKLDTVKR